MFNVEHMAFLIEYKAFLIINRTFLIEDRFLCRTYGRRISDAAGTYESRTLWCKKIHCAIVKKSFGTVELFVVCCGALYRVFL